MDETGSILRRALIRQRVSAKSVTNSGYAVPARPRARNRVVERDANKDRHRTGCCRGRQRSSACGRDGGSARGDCRPARHGEADAVNRAQPAALPISAIIAMNARRNNRPPPARQIDQRTGADVRMPMRMSSSRSTTIAYSVSKASAEKFASISHGRSAAPRLYRRKRHWNAHAERVPGWPAGSRKSAW